jgi:plastocyanin
MKNFDFSPMAIAVPAGTTVIWKNLDGEPHTVVSTDGLFRSKALDQPALLCRSRAICEVSHRLPDTPGLVNPAPICDNARSS